MNHNREIIVTRLLLALTAAATVLAFVEIGAIGADLARGRDWSGVASQLLFALVVVALTYGFLAYGFTRVAQLQRRRDHRPASAADLDAIFDADAAPLAVLVPSYKEELAVVRRTLLSAALQEYPNRRVVLLIDDPYQPHDRADAAGLRAMRGLPWVLQRLFDAPARRCAQGCADFARRSARGAIDPAAEASALAGLYRDAAAWIDTQIAAYPIAEHGDALFVSAVLQRCRDAYRQRATRFRRLAGAGTLDHATATREYRRLAALFRVEFASFERKRYENLSHAVNKAMNLNSYISLIGRSFVEARAATGNGVILQEVPRGSGTFDVPDAAFLLTLDADSVLLPDYALRLTHLLNQPGNERVAVAQTPYSAFPGAPGVLERTAGATTDIQYLIHQGFTRFNATFWVGANALLRKAALEEIRTAHEERGYPVLKYIQDRTVIEDTESSVDLADRGWTLHNYPERLAYSATPPDFGSLLIQRRRWANGGLIILPKALRYLCRGPLAWRKAAEGFYRVHYLTSLAIVNLALLLLLFGPFDRNMHNIWLVVCSVPYMVLYARDLVLHGYRWSDFLRVYALNLLLIPVHLAGVLKSLQQAATGKQTPFGRTPKVTGRTAAPGIYIVAEYGLFAASLAMVGAAIAHANWLSASFALTYVMFTGYAIVTFIGLPASAEDLRLWLRPPAPAQVAQPGSPHVDLRALPHVDAGGNPGLLHVVPGGRRSPSKAFHRDPRLTAVAERMPAMPAQDIRIARPANWRSADRRGRK
jgi:cellulose synthase (UDP-forming)